MQNKRGIVVIGIFIGSIFFYTFYLKERLAFNKAKESKTLPSLQSYFLDYPNGRYVKEVEIIEEQIAFKNVRCLIFTNIINFVKRVLEWKTLGLRK